MADDQIMQMQLVAVGWGPNGRDLLSTVSVISRNQTCYSIQWKIPSAIDDIPIYTVVKPPWTEGFPSHVQLIFSQRSIEQILGVIVLHASATGTPSVTPPLCDVARPGPSGERSPGPMQLSMLYPGLPVTCILGTFRNADTSNCASGLVVSNLECYYILEWWS